MSEVKIPFGRSVNGEMVSVDAVVRGKECNCFCSACSAPLVARKGEVNQHHFAHYAEPENCIAARETAIHRFAKGLICDVLNLRLPDNLNLGQMQNAKSEEWLDGIRPDVMAQFDELVAIEIRVAHPVPGEKIKIFAARKLAALEIDLSPYRNSDKNEEEWRDLVLRTAWRFWLFPPAIVRAEIEQKAQQEAERRLRIEREAQQEAERQAKIEQDKREEAERRRAQREFLIAQDRVFEELVSAEIIQRKAEQFKRQAQEQVERQRAECELEITLIESLKICAEIDNPDLECSVCGQAGNKIVGLRKDWQNAKWYCLNHRPWIVGGAR